VIAFGEPADGYELSAGIDVARARGCLTIAFSPLGAECELEPPSPDPFVRQEVIETVYHVLWELVHVFFEHRGLLEGRTERRSHDAGASSFLYPFLAEREHDVEAILTDVRESALMKAEEVQQLRVDTLRGSSSELADAAAAMRAALDGGGRVLALGNGGSATDAMDLVADLVAAPGDAGWPSRAALDLTADTAIITAIANDVGTESIFARQVIAYGRAGDALVALSTSGNSLSVLAALSEARRREMRTIAFVGYDGGRVAAEGLADHVIVTPSQHIPRIQEAQATAYHVLREMVELA
jgi:D-sedoheptulose 7-phosphate isomerase